MDVNAIILRQIYLQRYGDSYGQRLLDLHKSGDTELITFIKDWSDGVTDSDMEALSRNNNRNAKVKEFNGKMTGILVAQTKLTQQMVLDEMLAVADAEIKATFDAMEEKPRKIDPNDIMKLPVVGQAIMAGWGAHREAVTRHLNQSILNAAQEKSPLHVALIGTPDQNNKDGAFNIRNNAIVQLANTQINGTTSNARGQVYASLKITEENFLATLDHRTCIKCATAENQSPYPLGSGPTPPLHRKCRCIRIPTGSTSERPYVRDKRSVKDIPRSERAGKIGQTKLTYKEFFEAQTEAAKRNILGAGRYDLYKTGKFDITDFVSPDHLKIMTLEDLNNAINEKDVTPSNLKFKG